MGDGTKRVRSIFGNRRNEAPGTLPLPIAFILLSMLLASPTPPHHGVGEADLTTQEAKTFHPGINLGEYSSLIRFRRPTLST